MRHEMKLFGDLAFSQIQSGTKTVEMRLYDEKRAGINLGDEINFTSKTGDSLLVKVVGLCRFPNFDKMFKIIDPVKMGYQKTDSLDYCVEFMNGIYSPEDIKKYGALGIVIEVI